MKKILAGFAFAAVGLACACGGTSTESTTDGGGATGGNGASSGSGGGGNVSGSGGSGNVSGTGGSGGSVSDASDDAIPPADGPFACGSNTCAPTEFCIHPCCGGAPPPCFAKPEGGTCPAGSHSGCSFGGSGECQNPADCCEPDPCTPPPAYCTDSPEFGCMPNSHDCYLMCA